MSLLQKIIARGAEGRAALAAQSHAHPDLIPDWEGLAIAAFLPLVLFCALVLP